MAVIGQREEVGDAGLVIKDDSAIGEDHDRVRFGGAVNPVTPALRLKLVADITHPAEREIERQVRDVDSQAAQIPVEPVEERVGHQV